MPSLFRSRPWPRSFLHLQAQELAATTTEQQAPVLREDIFFVPHVLVDLMFAQVPDVRYDRSHLGLHVVTELLRVHLVVEDHLGLEANRSHLPSLRALVVVPAIA